jgi:hypothetical protein
VARHAEVHDGEDEREARGDQQIQVEDFEGSARFHAAIV